MTTLGKVALVMFGIGSGTIPYAYLAQDHKLTTSDFVHWPTRSKPLRPEHTAAVSGRAAHAQSAYDKLPVAFAQNQGQTDSRVRYFARGPNYAFFLASDEVVLSLMQGTRAQPENRNHKSGFQRVGPAFLLNAKSSAVGKDEPPSQGIALDLKFLGSNPNVAIDGEERARGNINYLRGNRSADWKTDVPQYSQVVYHELWPGIDLRVRVTGGALKYEFHVHPGAKVEDIRLVYRGVTSIGLDDNGSLLIETEAGTIRDTAPVSFQKTAGRVMPIDSRYELDPATKCSYGFSVGTGYRPDEELIIDPGIEYSTYLGGTSDDVARAVAVDNSGNVYVVGYTQSPDFPVTPGAFDRSGSPSNSLDAFVAKVNSTGTALIYATFLGGSNFDWGRSIAVDTAGNAYITGQTKSSDFPVTGKAFQKTLAHLNCPRCGIDNYDAFVAKLNPSGSGLVYSTYLGGAGSIDDGLAIAIDAAGNAYVAGETSSTDFPTTAGTFRRTNSGGDDTFIAKLNATGSALIYSTYIGGTQEEFPARIALDAANNAIVFGNTSSADFPTTPGVFDTTLNGGFDGFLLKLNAAGSNLIYSTFLGGSASESAGGLAVDLAGQVYVSGVTSSADYPTTPGAFRQICSSFDGFVTKLNASASTLVYSTCLANAASSAIEITPTGNGWITGSTSSPTFPVTADAFQRSIAVGPSGPVTNAIIAELNATGSAFLYATYLGGSGGDAGADLAIDSVGDVYIVGKTYSADFPTTPNVLDRVFGGRLDLFWGDGFIAKLALNGTAPPPVGPPVIAALAASGIQFVGGSPFTVAVTLSAKAQTGGAVVTLVSSHPAVSVPATLNIPAGSQTGTVTATTSVVTANTPVSITGSLGSVSKSTGVTLLPVPPPGTLSSLGMFPNTVTGGSNSVGIIGLSNPAPAAGYNVTLSSNNPIATVPPSVTVVAGETTATFAVNTVSVTQSTALTIFAKAGALTALAPLTVNPSTAPVTTLALTVNAMGRSGEHISSSPAGINVAVGSSMQSAFPSGTSISLSVSNGRDAIWSGACSSGGSKTKICTFSLNAVAGVTANVQ